MSPWTLSLTSLIFWHSLHVSLQHLLSQYCLPSLLQFNFCLTRYCYDGGWSRVCPRRWGTGAMESGDSPPLDPRGCRSGWDQHDRRQQPEGIQWWAGTAVLAVKSEKETWGRAVKESWGYQAKLHPKTGRAGLFITESDEPYVELTVLSSSSSLRLVTPFFCWIRPCSRHWGWRHKQPDVVPALPEFSFLWGSWTLK